MLDGTIGMCPATLVPDPMAVDDEAFEAVVRATAAAGFIEVSLWGFWATNYGLERARALLDSVGIRVRAVEGVGRWAQGPGAATDTEMAAMTEIATALGADMVLACSLKPSLASFDDAVAGFEVVCDQAAARDLRVSIEFFPWSGLPDLATAWRIVEASGAPNGGITIDMMHWQHQDGGPDFELLERIPGERIHFVQVCDTVGPRAPAGAYRVEANENRRVPGEGEIDVDRLFRTINAIGAEPFCAYEVFNKAMAARGPETMAQRIRELRPVQ